MPQLSLTGRVARATDLQPLASVPITLIGPLPALRDLPGVQPVAQDFDVCWTRPLTGFSGSRWDCWVKHVRGTVRGLTWQQFCDDALIHNPSLNADHVFKAHLDYVLPQEVPIAPFTWTRRLTGFSGSRWDCWIAHVQDTVRGITWAQFRDDALRYNPQLNSDGRLFRPQKSYLIPETVTTPRAMLATMTDAQGQYRFMLGSQPATVELHVELDDYARWQAPIVVNGALTQPILLQPDATVQTDVPRSGTIRSARPDYATQPILARRVIDWGLALLGDDTHVFDALPSDLQALCYGARFLNDPNNAHYKDFVCADIVSIAFAGAGIDIESLMINSHLSDAYHPDRGNRRLIEITRPDDWLPGDILVYGDGAPDNRASHVNLYVGPFTGTDRSGTSYSYSQGADVIEGSLDFQASGKLLGTGVIGVSLQRCLAAKRGYTWVRHVRLREIAAAYGRA